MVVGVFKGNSDIVLLQHSHLRLPANPLYHVIADTPTGHMLCNLIG